MTTKERQPLVKFHDCKIVEINESVDYGYAECGEINGKILFRLRRYGEFYYEAGHGICLRTAKLPRRPQIGEQIRARVYPGSGNFVAIEWGYPETYDSIRARIGRE